MALVSSLLVQITQMAEITFFVLITAQKMLDVARNGCIHIFIGAFLASKCRGLVVVDSAKAHGATVADILINTMDSEDRLKLPVWDGWFTACKLFP